MAFLWESNPWKFDLINMKKFLILKIIISVTICLAVGGFSGYLTSGSISNWYGYLNKPFFNPPDWVFGPVWSVLYTLMGISAGIIWQQGLHREEVKKALTAFGIHLVLNFSWSLVFFGLKMPELALIEILILLTSIFYFSRLFYKIKPITAWIQVPYMLWVSFATILNGAIAWLN